MRLALTMFRRSQLAILGSPQGRDKDQIRDDLVAALTANWESWRIERELSPDEETNLPALLAMGRAALPPKCD